MSDRKPHALLMVVRKKPTDKNAGIVIVWREWRSRWLRMDCMCRRPRKDGTCLYTDAALTQMTTLGRERTRRIEHPEATK